MNNRPIIQVAFADDHNIVRRGITDFINEMESGINVCIQAQDGKELLDRIVAADRLPDLCLLDIMMPVMDGFKTIVELKKKYPAMPVLVLSAIIDIPSEYAILRMMKLGANGYIGKNANPDELEKAMIDLYNGKRIYFSSTLLSRFPKMNEGNMKEYVKGQFSEQQIMFLSLCCSDLTYKQIGEMMNIGDRTAENYAAHICEKIQLHSRQELAMYALCAGIGSFNCPSVGGGG